MKSSKLFALFVFILFATLATNAFAHAEDTPTDNGKIIIGDETRSRWPMPHPKSPAQENTDGKRAELGERFDAFRKERIANMIAMMQRRFLAAIERLRGIADRIEARIEKIEDETDRDLTEAHRNLADARAHLDTAEDLIDDVSTSSADSLFDAATTTGQRFGWLRDLFAEAKSEIKEARESLGKALRATGWFRGKDKATTTSSHF